MANEKSNLMNFLPLANTICTHQIDNIIWVTDCPNLFLDLHLFKTGLQVAQAGSNSLGS